MNDIFEIYNSNPELGIVTRKSTAGKEFEMVKQFIEYRKELFHPTTTKKLAIFVEPKINNSYPDIVFAEYNPNNFEHWNKNRFKLTASDLRILYHIYTTRAIDILSIVNQLGVSWKEAALAIETLCDAELIVRKNRKWSVKDRKSLSVKKIEAVEAKINKLDEVFQQAIINKNFASESYALSKVATIPKQVTIDRFDKFGLGLYIQNKSGFNTIKEANKASIPVSFNSIFFNEWIGRALSLAERTV